MELRLKPTFQSIFVIVILTIIFIPIYYYYFRYSFSGSIGWAILVATLSQIFGVQPQYKEKAEKITATWRLISLGTIPLLLAIGAVGIAFDLMNKGENNFINFFVNLDERSLIVMLILVAIALVSSAFNSFKKIGE